MATACSQAEEAAEKADSKKTHADYYFHQGYALEQQAEKGRRQLGRREGPAPDGHPASIPNYAEAYGELAEVLLHPDDEAERARRTGRRRSRRSPTRPQYYVAARRRSTAA